MWTCTNDYALVMQGWLKILWWRTHLYSNKFSQKVCYRIYYYTRVYFLCQLLKVFCVTVRNTINTKIEEILRYSLKWLQFIIDTCHQLGPDQISSTLNYPCIYERTVRHAYRYQLGSYNCNLESRYYEFTELVWIFTVPCTCISYQNRGFWPLLRYFCFVYAFFHIPSLPGTTINSQHFFCLRNFS